MLDKTLFIVRGQRNVTSDLVIEPGTIVHFRPGLFTGVGQLIVRDGGTLVAEGLADNLISFDGHGRIEVKSTAGDGSSIRYCDFDGVSSGSVYLT